MKGLIPFLMLLLFLLSSCSDEGAKDRSKDSLSELNESEIRALLSGNGESVVQWQLISKTNEAGESKLTDFSKTLVCVYNPDGTFIVTANKGTKEVANGTYLVNGSIISRKYDNKQDALEVIELTTNSFTVTYPLAGGYITDKYEKR